MHPELSIRRTAAGLGIGLGVQAVALTAGYAAARSLGFEALGLVLLADVAAVLVLGPLAVALVLSGTRDRSRWAWVAAGLGAWIVGGLTIFAELAHAPTNSFNLNDVGAWLLACLATDLGALVGWWLVRPWPARAHFRG